MTAHRASHYADLRADIRRTWNLLQGGRLRRTLGCMRAPGVHAVVVYRFGRWLRASSLPMRIVLEPLYQVLYLLIQILWGIELPRSATIGPGLFIGHYGGITISPDTVMGEHCNISQNITIGVAGRGDKEGVPIIGNNVYIAPGARLFGKITIGSNVRIGANTVVYKDIPDEAIVVIDPGFKIVSYSGNAQQLEY